VSVLHRRGLMLFSMDHKNIVIVGGGACGVATFVHLVLKLIVEPEPNPVSFSIIEPRDEIGPGLAYDTGQKGHLLNTSAGLMGIFAEEPGHFVEWMAAHKEFINEHFPETETQADGYPPRQLYGIYLKDVFDEYVTLARQHQMPVELYQDVAVDADLTEKHRRVTLGSGKTIPADVLVLATGTPKPNNFKPLESSPSYLDSPWPSSRILSTITDKGASVCVLGASLTALDAVITLVNNGHRGPIKMYSKDGLLPRAQSPKEVPFDREVLTLANIRKVIRENKRALQAKDLFRLFQAEVERVEGPQDWKRFRRVGRPQLELLDEDIALAEKGESIFQNILYSTRYISFETWQLLPPDQRKLFAKWLKPYSDINRHAIPLQNALKLRQLLASGQLTVTAYSDEVVWNDEKKRYVLTTEKDYTDEVEYVINATGPAMEVAKMDVPILQQMLKKGYLLPCDAGGVQADVNTMQICVPGQTDAPVYGIGHVLVGELFDTNAVWFNVDQVDPMTTSILKQLTHERTE
jgi:uncharacterized NAD(P)/FAD-binding protein YdhS